MNQLLLTLFSLLAVAGCASGETEAKGTEESKKKAPVQQTAQVAAEAVNYVNGVTEKNAGDKVGPIRVHGTVKGGAQGKKIYLYETEGKNDMAIDSVPMTGGKFDFGVKDYHRGFYMLGMENDPNNKVAVILNPDEQEVDISFASIRLEASPTSVMSQENKGWFEYYKTERSVNNQIRALKKQRSGSSFKERITAQINEKEAALKAQQEATIKKYPDTFLAKFLTYKNSPNKGDKGKYWEDLDFTDESLVRMPVIPDRIQEFMRTHSGGNESGFYNCIDLVKAKAEVNPRVLEFSLYTMLDGFYQSGMETVSLYILDNYIFDDDCGANLSDVIKQRAEGIINLQIGKTPPNFVIPTWDGKTVDLMKEVKNHEYTLVMFWASWCHKCEQEIPVLKNVYEVYKSRGFGVVGVSVDQNRAAWEGAVKSNDLKWPNVSQLQMWDSPVAKDYKVTQTPSLFLLNKEGKIVDKPKRIYQVENFLKKNL